MRGRKIMIPLPNTGALARRKQLLCIRVAIALFVIIFIVIQLNVINYGELIILVKSVFDLKLFANYCLFNIFPRYLFLFSIQ